jgi:protein-tyrosine-phosphatase
MKTVLFACVHNAGRSQMAAGWFNELADPEKEGRFRRGQSLPAACIQPYSRPCARLESTSAMRNPSF